MPPTSSQVRRPPIIEELDDKIRDTLEDDKFEQDFTNTSGYQESTCCTLSWLRLALHDLQAPHVRVPDGGTTGKPLSAQQQSTMFEDV